VTIIVAAFAAAIAIAAFTTTRPAIAVAAFLVLAPLLALAATAFAMPAARLALIVVAAAETPQKNRLRFHRLAGFLGSGHRFLRRGSFIRSRCLDRFIRSRGFHRFRHRRVDISRSCLGHRWLGGSFLRRAVGIVVIGLFSCIVGRRFRGRCRH